MNKIIKCLLLTLLVFGATVSAHATLIDFKLMGEPFGSHGESVWSTLSNAEVDFTWGVIGRNGVNPAFAYLDASNAGLGVCKAALNAGDIDKKFPGSGANRCLDSSDDNVTTNEFLRFGFSKNVVIDRIWFNTNHDPDFSLDTDEIKIGGVDYTFNNLDRDAARQNDFFTTTPFSVNANTSFLIGFVNEQFYISAMSVRAVPEPATFALLGLGLLGLGIAKKRLTNR